MGMSCVFFAAGTECLSIYISFRLERVKTITETLCTQVCKDAILWTVSKERLTRTNSCINGPQSVKI
jgi:hypothetical protein